MIYLDNSATTPPYPEVLETYRIVSERFFANPSSIHSFGGKSEDLLNKSRQQAAELLGVKETEIVFTSGGTEGNNLAIKGVALSYQHRGKHLITTQIEHPASRNAFKQLEAMGFEVTYLDVDQNGQISIEDFKAALRMDTLLVSIIHVNNEIGTVQPLKEIGELLKTRPKTLFHVDHVQGLAKVPLNIKDTGIDLCTISGHKIHGPKGTGLLYVREGVNLEPLLAGGGQEHDRRSGTENLPAIAGMVKALRMTIEKSHQGIPKLRHLTDKIRKAFDEHPLVILHSNADDTAPHILNATVKGIRAEVLIHALEEEEIYISTKSACSSKETEASEILLACGVPEEEAKQAIRISLSFQNTEEEIDAFIAAFNNKVNQLQKVMEV